MACARCPYWTYSVQLCYYQHIMRRKAISLSRWVDDLEQRGRYTLDYEEAERTLGLHGATLHKALQRATSQGRVLRLRRGFYVIVPLEYRTAGAAPTEWFIDDLMRYLGTPYYIGCLSAAAWYGAAHQRIQETQVVVPHHVRNIETYVVRVRFLRFAAMAGAQTQRMRTHTGDVPVSTPEWTAIDLIRFQRHYGGLDAAATVLKELAERLDADRLAAAAAAEPTSAYLQRVGWLLDYVGKGDLTGPLHAHVVKRNPSLTPLDVSLKRRGEHRDTRWSVVVNGLPEADL